MAPEFLEVPGCAAQPGIDASANFTEQKVPLQAVGMLRMPNPRFDGRAAVEQLAQLRREIAASRNVHRHSLRMITLSAKARIDKGLCRADSC